MVIFANFCRIGLPSLGLFFELQQHTIPQKTAFIKAKIETLYCKLSLLGRLGAHARASNIFFTMNCSINTY